MSLILHEWELIRLTHGQARGHIRGVLNRVTKHQKEGDILGIQKGDVKVHGIDIIFISFEVLLNEFCTIYLELPIAYVSIC
jgi:hypothetical protein